MLTLFDSFQMPAFIMLKMFLIIHNESTLYFASLKVNDDLGSCLTVLLRRHSSIQSTTFLSAWAGLFFVTVFQPPAYEANASLITDHKHIVPHILLFITFYRVLNSCKIRLKYDTLRSNIVRGLEMRHMNFTTREKACLNLSRL